MNFLCLDDHLVGHAVSFHARLGGSSAQARAPEGGEVLAANAEAGLRVVVPVTPRQQRSTPSIQSVALSV